MIFLGVKHKQTKLLSLSLFALLFYGETIVLGGLIAEEVNETLEKVPWLGDIPLIGRLFRSTISSTEKSNLMVFLRATILRNDQSMGALSRRKY